jgi:hypothetical protein
VGARDRRIGAKVRDEWKGERVTDQEEWDRGNDKPMLYWRWIQSISIKDMCFLSVKSKKDEGEWNKKRCGKNIG